MTAEFNFLGELSLYNHMRYTKMFASFCIGHVSIVQGSPGARGIPGPKGRKGELRSVTQKGALNVPLHVTHES